MSLSVEGVSLGVKHGLWEIIVAFFFEFGLDKAFWECHFLCYYI